MTLRLAPAGEEMLTTVLALRRKCFTITKKVVREYGAHPEILQGIERPGFPPVYAKPRTTVLDLDGKLFR
jgi:hypothetical protein